MTLSFPFRIMTTKKRTERKRANETKNKKPTKSRKPLIIVALLIGIIVVAAGIIFILNEPFNNGTNGQDSNNETDNQDSGSNTENPVAIIKTSKGIVKIELFENKTPITVENFVKLSNDGFYDGMIFHRIMDNFMIQAGNTYPNGTSKISPYGNIVFESDSELTHEDGAISMASTGAKVGGSAQFFICDGAQPGLDGNYAVFGKTIEGIDVVRDIADEPHDNSYGSVGGGKPLEDILIYSITIEEF